MNKCGERKLCRNVTAVWDGVHRRPEGERPSDVVVFKNAPNSISVRNVVVVLGHRMRRERNHRLVSKPRNCSGRREGKCKQNRRSVVQTNLMKDTNRQTHKREGRKPRHGPPLNIPTPDFFRTPEVFAGLKTQSASPARLLQSTPR